MVPLRILKAPAPIANPAISEEKGENQCLPSWGDSSAHSFLTPDDMDWISDLRDVNLVKASVEHRIRHATTQRELIVISRTCEDWAVAFQLLGEWALKKETA